MKRILCLVVALATMTLGMNAMASSFGSGNVVIYRVGNGSAALTNTGNAVFLDEYTTNAIWAAAGGFSAPAPVQSVALPTTWVGNQAPLIADGGALLGGALSRSADGRFLVLTGFGATIGQLTNSSVGSSSTTGAVTQIDVARVVGLVDGLGHIYTGIAQTNANEDGDGIRTAVSTDGTNVWVGGDSGGAKFVYGGRGAVTNFTLSMLSTQVAVSANGGAANTRVLNLTSNTLYICSNGRVAGPTNGAVSLPTSFVAHNFTNLPGVYGGGQGSPVGFCFFNLANQNSGGALPDTLYVADDVTNAPGEPVGKAGGVLKYCYSGGTWVNYGYVYAQGATFVTGFQNGTNVDLYITEGGTITPNELNVMYPYHDTSGYAGSPQNLGDTGDANQYSEPISNFGNPALINTRGIAVTPQGGDSGTITGPGVISVGPPFAPYYRGAAGGPFNQTNTYSVANLGSTLATCTVTFASFSPSTWVTISPSGSFTLNSGASQTLTVTANGTANTEAGGATYTGRLLFHNGGAGGTVVFSPTATLIVDAFFVTPSSNFVSQGQVGGPFSPASAVYVISNATAGPLSWAVTNAVTWYTISATNGSLPGATATNITVSINATANSLPVGVYSDTIVFSNVTGNAQLTTHFVDLQVGVGFFDDFSTYTQDANLAGQDNWAALDPTAADNPPQVTGGQVVLPYGCPGISANEPWQNFSARTITDVTQNVYAGMLVTVTGAPTYPTSPNYSFAIYSSSFLGGFADDRVGLSDTGTGTYMWDCHISGIDGWQFGQGHTYSYNTQYMVIIVGDVANSNTWVFVNPSDGNPANLLASTPAVHDGPGSPGYQGGGADPTAGSFLIGNYCNGINQSGLSISKLAVSTNYTDVYNFLIAVAPPTDPFTAWQNAYFTPAELGTPSFSGASADPFGTGMSNTNKFLAGFNPTNSAAYLHIINVSRALSGGNTNVTVTYLGANGDNTYSPGFASRTNILEYTAGTANGSYATNNFLPTGQTNVLMGGTGLGVVTNMTDSAIPPTSTNRYYRVRVLLP